MRGRQSARRRRNEAFMRGNRSLVSVVDDDESVRESLPDLLLEKAHRGQVMRKMAADSLPGLVTMSARLGLRSASHRPSRS
jgi:FixJ family two-component response regulator